MTAALVVLLVLAVIGGAVAVAVLSRRLTAARSALARASGAPAGEVPLGGGAPAGEPSRVAPTGAQASGAQASEAQSSRDPSEAPSEAQASEAQASVAQAPDEPSWETSTGDPAPAAEPSWEPPTGVPAPTGEPSWETSTGAQAPAGEPSWETPTGDSAPAAKPSWETPTGAQASGAGALGRLAERGDATDPAGLAAAEPAAGGSTAGDTPPDEDAQPGDAWAANHQPSWPEPSPSTSGSAPWSPSAMPSSAAPAPLAPAAAEDLTSDHPRVDAPPTIPHPPADRAAVAAARPPAHTPKDGGLDALWALARLDHDRTTRFAAFLSTASAGETDDGLSAALADEVSRVREETGTPGTLRADLADEPEPADAIVLLRAVQAVLAELARYCQGYDLYVHRWEDRLSAVAVLEGFDGPDTVGEELAGVAAAIIPAGGELDTDRDDRDRMRVRLSFAVHQG